MKGFKNFKMKFKNSSSLIVANMELLNGDIEMFVVEVKHKSFKILNGEYIVNEDYLKYNRTLKMWEAKYHQICSVPIDQTIPITKLTKGVQKIENSEVRDIVNNLNPEILVNFVRTQIIQKVFAGEEMQNIFGFIKIMLILIAVGVVIAVVVLLAGVI
jgi:hypothetical protein